MKSYPPISKKILYDYPVVVFDKLDGSNLRVEVSTKRGMYKFGSRTQLIDKSHPVLGSGIEKMLSYEEKSLRLLKNLKENRAVLFFEFHGPNSFAGFHDPSEDQTVTLIDATIGNKGFVHPWKFESLFHEFPIPKVLRIGKITPEIESQIKNGTFPRMTFEGVVCKPHSGSNFKIKNQNWLDKLRSRCKTQEEFEKLA